MRLSVLCCFALTLWLAAPLAAAAGFDDKPLDERGLAQLELRAQQAQPREQCLLYAQLVHQLTEFSLRRYAAGDVPRANEILHHIQQLTRHIHNAVVSDTSHLKSAEILLRHTAFRLAEMVHNTNSEDRPLVEQTLAQVNDSERETMLAVFQH